MATVIRSTSPTSSTPARATRSSLPDPSELAPPKRQVLRKEAAARDSSRAVALLCPVRPTQGAARSTIRTQPPPALDSVREPPAAWSDDWASQRPMPEEPVLVVYPR